MFKSGTSLLRAMVGRHRKIASGLETYWFDLDWSQRDGDGTEFRRRLHWLANFYEFDRDEVVAMADTSGSVYAFLTKFLDSFAARQGKTRWAEKTPGNIRHLDRIVAGWPDAQIVHIVRDPKDVFASLKQAKKWDTIEEFSERWCAFFGGVEDFRTRLDLNAGRYVELRYEALVHEPVKTMRALFEFLGEEWSDDLADFRGNADDYNKVLSTTGKASTTLSRLSEPINTARVGIWRDIVDDSEIRALRAAVSESGLLKLFEQIEDATPLALAASRKG
jgi:hypothetical protein